MNHPFLASVTRIADLEAYNFATSPLPREGWETGDYVVARVRDTRGHRWTGRFVDLVRACKSGRRASTPWRTEVRSR